MLKFRFISGLSLVGMFLLSVFWNSPISTLLFIVISETILILAILEYFSLTKSLDLPGYPYLTTAVGFIMVIALAVTSVTTVDTSVYFYDLENILLSFFLIFIFICVFKEHDLYKGISSLLISLGGYVYIIWSLLFMAKIYFSYDLNTQNGKYLFLYFILVTKCADIGGYFAGKITASTSTGNHKMVPKLSPQKSWEGLAGSFCLSIAISLLLITLLSNYISFDSNQTKNVIYAVTLGILLTIIGLVGDLSVSVLKRATKQKDSGSSIPGFGGMLDVVDSLILSAPFFYYFIKTVIKI